MILAGMLNKGDLFNDEGIEMEVIEQPEFIGGLVHMIANPLGTDERKLVTYDPSEYLLEV